jgi:outer membrane immunogenic protein
MRKALLFSCIAFGALASNAVAADLPTMKGPAPTPVAQPFSWTGFYAGVSGGYADPTAKLGVAPGSNWNGDVDWNANSSGPGVSAAGTARVGLQGFIGGVTAGYNYQINNFVLGVEADASYLDLHGSYATPTYNGEYGGTYWANGSASVNSLFTLRARAGLAFDRLLVFVTGGLGVANEKFSQSIGFNQTFQDGIPNTGGVNGYNAGSASTDAVTGVFGGGIEYAFNKNWSLKGEYLYAPLRSQSFTSTYTDISSNVWTVYHHESLSSLNVFRVGLNYRFD